MATAPQPPRLPQLVPPGTMPDRFYDAYCAAAHMRLSSRDHARTWWSLGIPAETAGAWARHGFTPEQAWGWMSCDVGPDAAARAAGRHPQ